MGDIKNFNFEKTTQSADEPNNLIQLVDKVGIVDAPDVSSEISSEISSCISELERLIGQYEDEVGRLIASTDRFSVEVVKTVNNRINNLDETTVSKLADIESKFVMLSTAVNNYNGAIDSQLNEVAKGKQAIVNLITDTQNTNIHRLKRLEGSLTEPLYNISRIQYLIGVGVAGNLLVNLINLFLK